MDLKTIEADLLKEEKGKNKKTETYLLEEEKGNKTKNRD